MKKIYILLFLCLMFAGQLIARNLHVGTGEEYESIQIAVNDANDGDVIIIHPDEYEETVSIIDFTGNLTIKSIDPDDWDIVNSTTIFMSGNNSPIFEISFPNSSATSRISFEGLTINDGSHGISIYECESTCNFVMKNCIVNSAYLNGISYVGNNSGQISLDNCKITCNHYGIRTDEVLELHNCEITHNHYAIVANDDLYMYSSTVAWNNYNGVDCWDGEIKNSIIWNYPFCIQITPGANIEVTYSDVYICDDPNGVYPGEGNINSDPIFTNPGNFEFTLQWNENDFSPCIDTGDPTMNWDDDDTPPDMGYHPARIHRYDKWKLPTANEHHGIKWMSLPALDDLTNSTEYDGDMAAYLLEDILSFTILDTIIWKPLEEEKMRLYFVTDPGYWENDDHIFTSPQGYKFKMFPELEESVPLNISGFHADTLTIIDLCGDGEENWIGYFCDKTQKLRNAFGQIWDNIAAIKTQHWSVVRITQGEEEWLGDIIKPTLSYGDMVIVKCYDDDSFIWNNYFGPGDTYNRPETEHFDFVEELDYIPVFIEHDPNDLPTEVGLFINDICKGAAVVEGDQTQVNGYIMNNESEELSVHYYYDDRSEIKTIDNYQILDPVTMLKEEGKIIVDPAEDYYYVSFNEKNDYTLLDTELQINVFPNPFIIND